MRAFIAGVFAAALALGPGATVAAEKPPPITLEAINAGMVAAPTVVSQAGLDCQVSDARLLGADRKTKGLFYELACKGAEGFIVGLPAKDSKFPLVVYTCLEAALAKNVVKAGDACRLPENADPKAGIAPLVAQNQPSCHMTDARAIGHTDTATALEVACAGGAGYTVKAAYPLSTSKPATFSPCAGLQPGMTLQCVLTDAAATNAYVASLVARSGKPCQMRDHRYVGVGSSDGDSYYEVACQGGGGFILDVDAGGNVYPTPCDQADYIGGGCKLSKR